MITEQQIWDALPSHGFLRSYVEYASHCTDANIAYHVAGGLSCLTQCVPLDYAVPYTSPLYGTMFSMVVGASSRSRKTASLAIAQRILRDAIADSIIETPGSQEGLYEGLRHHPRQLIVYPEWGEFLAKAEEGYMMPVKTAFTNVWDGLAAGRALAKKRDGIIEKPRLSLLCAVATDLLERHTEQADWTGGFLARFLTFYAEPEREFPTPPIDDEVRRLEMTRWLEGLADPRVQPGRSLWLDDQAQSMWHDWYDGLRPLISGSVQRAAAACSRASAIAAKITLLLAWDIGEARSGQPWRATVRELEPALKLTNLHLESVLELGERITGTKDMRDRSLVLRSIGLQPTPLGWILREAEMLKRRAKEIIESLVEERAIAAVKVGNDIYYQQTPQAHSMLAQAVLQARQEQSAIHSVIADANLEAHEGEQRLAQVIAMSPPRLDDGMDSTDAVDTQDDDAAYWASYHE